jgi:hypothetical protein
MYLSLNSILTFVGFVSTCCYLVYTYSIMHRSDLQTSQLEKETLRCRQLSCVQKNINSHLLMKYSSPTRKTYNRRRGRRRQERPERELFRLNKTMQDGGGGGGKWGISQRVTERESGPWVRAPEPPKPYWRSNLRQHRVCIHVHTVISLSMSLHTLLLFLSLSTHSFSMSLCRNSVSMSLNTHSFSMSL